MSRIQLPGSTQPNEAFGRAVRTFRIERGWSQEELAERCDMDRTYISGVERGRRNPTIQAIYRIGGGLGVLPSEILKIVEAALASEDNG